MLFRRRLLTSRRRRRRRLGVLGHWLRKSSKPRRRKRLKGTLTSNSLPKRCQSARLPDCHPERAFFAKRRTWASRANRLVICDDKSRVRLASLLRIPLCAFVSLVVELLILGALRVLCVDGFYFRCAAWNCSTRSRMRTASALRWPWLVIGSVPPVESMRISDQIIPF